MVEHKNINADLESNHSDSDFEIRNLPKPHKCTYDGCEKSFQRPSKLTDHLRRHTQERIFKCDNQDCEKSFYNKQSLKRHQQEAHLKKVENAMCPFEGCMQVMRKNSLQKHILRKHNSLRKYTFQCEECGKGLKSELELRQHLNEHTDVYRCGVCDKVFQKGYRFNAHLKIHEKQYVCNCQQLFVDYDSYNRHKKICKFCKHRCEQCPKVFSTKFNLKEHEKTHLVTKPTFQCTYDGCSRQYYQRKNLTHHIQTYHFKSGNGSSWICEICQKNFKSKIILRKHRKKFHENPDPPTVKNRRPRIDKGIPKIPMVTVLTGIECSDEERKLKRIIGNKSLEESSMSAVGSTIPERETVDDVVSGI